MSEIKLIVLFIIVVLIPKHKRQVNRIESQLNQSENIILKSQSTDIMPTTKQIEQHREGDDSYLRVYRYVHKNLPTPVGN